jgi:hypothetical protein
MLFASLPTLIGASSIFTATEPMVEPPEPARQAEPVWIEPPFKRRIGWSILELLVRQQLSQRLPRHDRRGRGAD